LKLSRSIDQRVPAQAALVIHPSHQRADGSRSPSARLEEAVGLARALDLDVRQGLIAPLRAATPATLFGKGKVEEIAALCEAEGIDLVAVDDALTPIQQRNLERAWGVKVVDRTGLILEIFGRRARTREGRLQVELARLDYERSRLVRTWTHLERQRGGFGFLGGPGETQIEADRRLLVDRIVALKAELAEVRRTRGLQRQARKRVPYPTIALVGYTNAGKSTLFNRLTRAEVLAQDMLFATLDPTLRQVRLPGGRPAILSDTVGFISDLPHELVEAFRATLEEVREADVILHVRDIAGPDSVAEGADVAKVLAELGIDPSSGRTMLEVWNKADLVEPALRDDLADAARHAGAVVVSATVGEGIEALLRRLAGLVDSGPDLILELAPSDGEALAWLYRHGRVIAREEINGSVVLSARLDPQALGRFERMRPDAFGPPSYRRLPAGPFPADP
jgi:GTP-binding protein HflX